MSHVDEGMLHAYLDGAPAHPGWRDLEAHIDGCADCRARLDAERAVRDRAAHVLRQVAPDAVRVEPFAAILAARRGRGVAAAATPATDAAMPEAARPLTPADTSRRMGRRSWPQFRTPLAAAATVVLAVSAMWIARSMQSVPSAPADSAALEARTVGGAASPATAPAEDGRVGPAVSADPARMLDSAARVAAYDELVSGAVRDGERDDASARRLDALRPPPTVPVTEGQQGQRSVEETRRISELIVTGRAQEAVGAQADPAAKASDAAAPDTFATRMIAAATSASWSVVTRDAAARLLGREPAIIEGVAVDTTQAATVAGGILVRIVQSPQAGRPLEILQWNYTPVAAPASMAAAPPPARQERLLQRADAQVAQLGAVRERANEAEAVINMLTITVAGSQVVLRAALPADSLARIAQRIR